MINLRGYIIADDAAWRNGSCGKTVLATKGGKKFFIKQYVTVKRPLNDGSFTPELYNKNLDRFNRFVAYRSRANQFIRSLTGPGGNIIIPCEEFEESASTGFTGVAPIHYTEVSEFIEGAVKDDDLMTVINNMSLADKEMVLRTATATLMAIHGRGIAHGDLKLKNILLVKHPVSGNYVAKLIDFDSAFFVDDKSMGIGGDEVYCSPELGIYSGMEDCTKEERLEYARCITQKTDIFSLGVIFHYYLSGEFPEAINLTERLQRRKNKGKNIYCSVALNEGCNLQISDRITNPKYIRLIEDMLNKDPEARPTASQVLARLRGSEEAFSMDEPWPEHNVIFNETRIKSAGYVMLRRAGDKKYSLLHSDGVRREFDIAALKSNGFANSALAGIFEEPWPEHNINFDLDKIKAKGYVGVQRKEQAGVKGYIFLDSRSTERFMNVTNLGMLGLSRPKGAAAAARTPTPAPAPRPAAATTISGFAEPWPEHNIVFDLDKIKLRGYVAIARVNAYGINGYNFQTESGTVRFFKVDNLLLTQLAKRK